MSRRTPHEFNPILRAPREGVDYRSCWTCKGCSRIPKALYPVKVDMGHCGPYGDVVTDVHEPNECDEWAPR